MRKIVVFNMVSLDGYFAREDGNIDWHNVDDEFNEFAVAHTADFGGIIFGRTTYELFAEFWPTVIGNKTFSAEDQQIADTLQHMDKFVFSKTLKEVKWDKAKLFHDIDPEAVKAWKKEEGKDMVIFGSGTIVQAFTKLGLIDEYRMMVNPIILGHGKPMFEKVDEVKLELINTKKFQNGNILLYYTSVTKGT